MPNNKARLRAGTIGAIAALALLLAMPVHADPFEDAHRSLVAGHLDEMLLTISIGAIAANSQDENGYTLLHYAAGLGALDAVNALIERGADPTMKAKDGKTPFDLATNAAVRAQLQAAVQRRAANAPSD